MLQSRLHIRCRKKVYRVAGNSGRVVMIFPSEISGWIMLGKTESIELD
jgi:hypothetical protein